jgi:hypothetical protein
MKSKKQRIVLFSEVIKNIKSIKAFCKENKIEPFALIILWWEKDDK